eukprot:m.17456 g.17456  ORF g.17456 m.17456 type:complete len:709 (+) comp5458_c0_seq1:1117-3243(+)
MAADEDGSQPSPDEVAVDQGDLELDLGELDLTTEDVSFDDVGGHIQENLDDELVREALDKGLDLRVYSRTVEDDLIQAENSSLQDYVDQAPKMAKLHNQIKACDSILERMEEMLSCFRLDLGNISGEIQSLQEQSLGMSVKLRNRKAVQADLGTFVNGMVISPQLVDTICQGQVNEDFQEALQQLHEKLEFVEEQGEETASVTDVSLDLERLKIKATAKTREYMLSKISATKKPMSNPQMQQNALLKLKEAFRFLVLHHHQTAAEIRDEYVDTMSKIHFSYFKAYLGRLLKLQFDDVADKDDVIGMEDTAKRGFFQSSRPAHKQRGTVFTIGNRGALLMQLEEPILVPHTAKDGTNKDQKFPYERLFRSFQYALLDNAAREYLFLAEFFNVSDTRAYELFKGVMGKTLSLLTKHLETFTGSCFDAIGLAICGRINQHYKQMLRDRSIPCLRPYFDHVNQIIWARFSHIISLNVDSVRAADPHTMASIDTRPHYIVRRYAEFSGALLSLNEGQTFEAITTGLMSLMEEVGNFILRMAAEYPQRREQLVLLINNYDMMLSVYGEHASSTSEEVSGFSRMLKDRTSDYAELQIDERFGGLMQFVKQTEGILNSAADKASIRVEQGRIQGLIDSFGQGWKASLTAIDSEVMRSFTNFKTGTGILQEVLTQLVVYYERFLAILKQKPYRETSWAGLIDRHQVMVEVKKHNKTF